MLRKIHVFDDIIDKNHQEKLKKIMLGKNFPWFFSNDISYENNKEQSRPGFKHYFVIDKKINSSLHEYILPIINNALKKAKFKYKDILQGRSFFQLPLNIKDINQVDTPHIDFNEPHVVVLYYVIDNEAHTIIYKDKKLFKKVKPKQGRVVVFNGSYWHTAEQPKQNKRCIINYNVI